MFIFISTKFSAQELTIGDFYQGGIIFYLDSTNQYGLIAAENDINPEIEGVGPLPYCVFPFGTPTAVGPSTEMVETDTLIGSGLQNCINLLNRDDRLTLTASINNGTFTYPVLSSVKVCDTATIGGYTDWYLPSKNELLLMYDLRNTIGNFATNPNGGTVYGSSSLVDSGLLIGEFLIMQSGMYSWNIQFNYNPSVSTWPFQRPDINGYFHIVRPIRTFYFQQTLFTENSEKELEIYPNPTSTEINLSIPTPNPFTIELYNALGETILKTQNQNKIDVSQLSKGLYFINLNDGKTIYSQKIIIR